ncbi:DER1-domain-containing protein [Auriculariales sp. MPI-PUGE-AT-0066]|nr:DER1-domain-containing protein [Auriculariales sp. MPI-PUGE-AT-0066]
MADQFIAELRKIPPVTRTIVVSTLVLSLSVILQLVNPRNLYYHWHFVKQWELWRLYSCWFVAGSGLNLIFSVLMLYRNLNELEEQSYHRRSHDLAWQTILALTALLIINIPLGGGFLFNPMYICFVYVSCWLSNSPTYFPFALVFLDVISGGPSACLPSLTGCMVGHAWWLIEWRGGQRQNVSWTRAPEWFKQWFAEPATQPGATSTEQTSNEGRAYGEARAPNGRGFGDGGFGTGGPRRQAGGQQGGGYNWGTGNRLGVQ